jgi:hypothetical protein
MKTIFDTQTINELLPRISSLKSNSKNEWGKMDAYQMLKHCTLSEEMFHGKKTYKRLFIGRLFGALARNAILKNENPIKKNQPTHPEMRIKGRGDFESERTKWIQLLNAYSQFTNLTFVHPFFGEMTKEEIGKYVYKHTDHHLRQFGV